MAWLALIVANVLVLAAVFAWYTKPRGNHRRDAAMPQPLTS
jgi:hypothetical protein